MTSYIVSSIESSGSTFVWQVVNRLDKGRTRKAHAFIAPRRNNFIFFVYRDPRDIICSYAQRLFAGIVRKHGIEAAMLRAHEALFKELSRQNLIKKYLGIKKQTCIIKYEDYFKGNELELVSLIARKMRVRLSKKARRDLLAEFSIVANKKRADKIKGGFGSFDKETNIHGNHISSNGKIGIWKELFTDEVKKVVKEDLGEFIVELGYEEDMDW